MNVYVGTNSMKNAYIGEVWTPGSNTIAYYPLTSTTTVNDMSGNGNNLTNNGSVTFNTLGGVFNSNKYLSGSNFSGMPTGNSNRTYSIWFNMAGSLGTSNYVYSFGTKTALKLVAFSIYANNTYIDYWDGSIAVGSTMPTNTWKNAVFTNENGTQTLYIDGVKIGTTSKTLNTTNNLLVGLGDSIYYFNGQISNLIIENRAWTAQEISHYYDITKSNYGL